MDRDGRSSGHAMSDEQQYGDSGVDRDLQLSEVRPRGLRVDSLREEGGSHADRPRHRQLTGESKEMQIYSMWTLVGTHKLEPKTGFAEEFRNALTLRFAVHCKLKSVMP